jgi:predicted Zn-dependent protease
MKAAIKMNKRSLILFIMIAVLCLSLLYGSECEALLSIEEESKIGQSFVMSVANEFEIVQDYFVNQYITDLAQALIAPLEDRPFPFRFYIINNPTLNAFAGPGGHIFIFSGLIMSVDSLDELVAVICHEMGHVTARHLAHRIERSQKISWATLAGMLAGILIGGDLSGAVIAGSQAAGAQAELGYSRNDERQADQLGFKYSSEVGFDPSAMIAVQKKLEGLWLGAERPPAYLLTHPGGAERMANTEAMLVSYKPAKKGKKIVQLEANFPYFKSAIIAKYLSFQDGKKFFENLLRDDPYSPIGHFGLGLVWQERSEFRKAVDNFKIALESQPRSLIILRYLAEAYQMEGDNREAIRVLHRAMEMDSRDRGTLFLLAMSYQNLDANDKAIPIFERLAGLRPVSLDVYYQLGVSYGRLNQLGRAHFNFGTYYMKMGNLKEAKFHFTKASSYSNKDPALQRRIEEAMKGLPLEQKEGKAPSQ